MRIVPLIAIAFLPLFAAGQDIRVLRPVLGARPDLSPVREAEFTERDSLLAHVAQLDTLGTARLQVLLGTLGRTTEKPCDIPGGGNAGDRAVGPDTIWASTRLSKSQPSDDVTFVHDMDYCTSWTEHAPGPGIGERLTFRFAADSPRISSITVVNGFVSDSTQWLEYNRVKRMMVSENGNPFVMLAMENSRAEQRFVLPCLMGRRPDGRPMELSFTLTEVYLGKRTDNTVITEIYFDGPDMR